MHRRSVVLAGAGLLGLALGLWVLDWWALRLARGELHANLRTIEACNPVRCEHWTNGGILSTAVLVSGSLLGLVTLAIAAVSALGAQIGKRLLRTQIMLALLALAGAVVMMAMTPDKLTGAGIALGGWATVVGILLCGASGLAQLRGDDPLGEGARYVPVKVDVPADVVSSNVKLAGATIPPFAVAQRTGTTLPPMAAVTAAAAAQGGTVPPPWQPAIKDIAHTEAVAPRRSSTRAPYTAPPTFDAARQALRFVVAEAAIGADGLTVTLEDHRKIELAWKVFTRASARQLPPGPPFDKLIVVDLGTIGGAPVRFLPSSRVNYGELPGGAAPNSRENLRRLVAHVKSKQPTFGVEHDSAEFFAGGREPPALMSLKQFMTYDEQYAGVIGTPPPDAA